MANTKFTNTPSGEWTSLVNATSSWVWDTVGTEPNALEAVLEYVTLEAVGYSGNRLEFSVEPLSLEGYSGGELELQLEQVSLSGVVELTLNTLEVQTEFVDLVLTGGAGLVTGNLNLELESAEVSLVSGAHLEIELEPVLLSGRLSMGMSFELEHIELEMNVVFGADIVIETKNLILQLTGTASYNQLVIRPQWATLTAFSGSAMRLILQRISVTANVGNAALASLNLPVQFPTVRMDRGADVRLVLRKAEAEFTGENMIVARVSLKNRPVELTVTGNSGIRGDLGVFLRVPGVVLTGSAEAPEENSLELFTEEADLGLVGSSWLHSDMQFQIRKLKLLLEGGPASEGDLVFEIPHLIIDGRVLNTVDGAASCFYEDLEFVR